MIPQRAYVDFPRHTVRTSRGILKYSIVRASANEFGGTMQTSVLTSTKERGSNALGSMTVLLIFVNTLNSSATRMSYPYDERPNDTTPARTWRSSNGSIIRCSSAIFLIQRSDLMDMHFLRKTKTAPDRPSSPQHGQEERQDDTQQNRCGERKVERAAAFPDDDIPRQPAKRYPGHHQQTDPGDQEPADEQQLAHGYRASSTPGKK